MQDSRRKVYDVYSRRYGVYMRGACCTCLAYSFPCSFDQEVLDGKLGLCFLVAVGVVGGCSWVLFLRCSLHLSLSNRAN